GGTAVLRCWITDGRDEARDLLGKKFRKTPTPPQPVDDLERSQFRRASSPSPCPRIPEEISAESTNPTAVRDQDQHPYSVRRPSRRSAQMTHPCQFLLPRIQSRPLSQAMFGFLFLHQVDDLP